MQESRSEVSSPAPGSREPLVSDDMHKFRRYALDAAYLCDVTNSPICPLACRPDIAAISDAGAVLSVYSVEIQVALVSLLFTLCPWGRACDRVSEVSWVEGVAQILSHSNIIP
jgi:hypothetical protein